MPRGNPDYLSPNSNVSTVQFDGASIVGGLGGIQSVDGRGRIVYADKFSNGLNSWYKSYSGAGIAPYLSYDNGYPFYPPVSVVLDPVAAAGNSVLTNQFPFVYSGRFGLEVAFYTGVTVAGFSLYVDQIISSQRLYQMEIKYSRLDKKLYILDPSGYVDLLDFTTWGDIPEDWFTVKLVFDTSKDVYSRAVIGGVEFDLSGYSIRNFEWAAAPRLYISLKCVGEVGFVEPSGVGYVIITNDEP